MEFTSIKVLEDGRNMTIVMDRAADKNSLNKSLMVEMEAALDRAEANTQIRTIILEGLPGIFCTGMDFKELASDVFKGPPKIQDFSIHYMSLLKRLTTIPKAVIAKVDGKVIAGGVGLVAASDIVIASEKSSFCLSEALWGILPANVMPFLIRRVGFQRAYFMTMTTKTISAKEAFAFQLVDEISDHLDDSIRRLNVRLQCLEESTLLNLKTYFRKMWIVDEAMEKVAMDELSTLLEQEHVKSNIINFVEKGKTPWESSL